MSEKTNRFQPLPQEFQIDHYVAALREATARVRYILITLTVAIILIFVGFCNSRENGWFNSRLEVARAAADAWGPDTTDLNTVLDGLKVEIREVETRRGEGEDSSPSNSYSMTLNTGLTTEHSVDSYTDEEMRERIGRWLNSRHISSRSSIEDLIRVMETSRAENSTVMRIPILGLAFDINDLGLFSGVSFVILKSMLAFGFSRYHEDQFLALWKVRRICEQENRPSQEGSVANLIYHSLAMAQVFSKPPSLARPEGGNGKSLSKIILIGPIFIQCLIFYLDSETIDVGKTFDNISTTISLATQALCIVLVFFLTLACWAYIRSSEKRWRQTFFSINPSYRKFRQPSWLEWVGIIDTRKDYKAEIRRLYEEEHGEL